MNNVLTFPKIEQVAASPVVSKIASHTLLHALYMQSTIVTLNCFNSLSFVFFRMFLQKLERRSLAPLNKYSKSVLLYWFIFREIVFAIEPSWKSFVVKGTKYGRSTVAIILRPLRFVPAAICYRSMFSWFRNSSSSSFLSRVKKTGLHCISMQCLHVCMLQAAFSICRLPGMSRSRA